MNTDKQQEYLTKRELAKRLHKSTRCLENWAAKGLIPYIKVERSVLFPWADVQEALRGFYRKGGAR
jgi:excisionase family DNA binding protein